MVEARLQNSALEPQDVCGSFVLSANGLGRWDTSRRSSLG